MFDVNEFKRKTKSWIRNNPGGTEQDLRDFCEEMIPAAHYTTYGWLVDQTVSWYRHIVAQKDLTYFQMEDNQEVA